MQVLREVTTCSGTPVSGEIGGPSSFLPLRHPPTHGHENYFYYWDGGLRSIVGARDEAFPLIQAGKLSSSLQTMMAVSFMQCTQLSSELPSGVTAWTWLGKMRHVCDFHMAARLRPQSWTRTVTRVPPTNYPIIRCRPILRAVPTVSKINQLCITSTKGTRRAPKNDSSGVRFLHTSPVFSKPCGLQVWGFGIPSSSLCDCLSRWPLDHFDGAQRRGSTKV